MHWLTTRWGNRPNPNPYGPGNHDHDRDRFTVAQMPRRYCSMYQVDFVRADS